ncbi:MULTISPECIES: 2-oxoacid:acceptor oxidoreductase subunit alpha [unclassified Sulfurimonas]|uniref:2-oxoacid:acceptor oxidoreductase subunit alpha n=1 Tax=unclassified Sulfurimonas TaxID=2623549 RepID=UPI000ADCF7EA|nr:MULTISPECIES: 2-oxoacid:acceptor oxidoreductase subunit alpha [unclassified Sulfurimonas]
MTLEELSRFNGKNGAKAYVAYKGLVYDLTSSDMWEEGEHQGSHEAGVDLTEAMGDAPHADDVLKNFRVVDKLVDSSSKILRPKQEAIVEATEPLSTKETLSAKEKWHNWYQIYHPHPVTAHFPIVLHFFAAAMDIAFFFSPVEKFEQGTYYAFLAATLLGLFAMSAGVLSWWVNYNFSMIRALVIKLYTAIFTLIVGMIGIYLHIIDPMIAYKDSIGAIFYHFSILITVPSVIILGYYGGRLTWWRAKTSDEETNFNAPKPNHSKTVVLSQNDFTIMIGGSAGSGIKTIEDLLTHTFVSMGYSIFSTKEYMSRVRGGSNTVQIRISDKDIRSAKWKPDLFLGLDEASLLHVKERIGDDTLVIGGQNESFSNHLKISLQEEAKKHVSKQLVNTFAAGMLFALLKLPKEVLEESLKKRFKEDMHEANIKALQEGYMYAQTQKSEIKKLPVVDKSRDKEVHYIDGTTAAGFGFLAGGCNSVTSYPMSPSTGVLAFLAGMSKEFDIAVEQAEDEIAAFNMALGVWYGGGRGLTTTSGGGFALMSESMSLSGMTETPMVVYLAQRPGPATGLPTRTEQGDLNLALYSGHGEFARLILAPGDALEAIELGHLAFETADRFQIPVVYLSDQYLADSVQSIPKVDFELFSQNRYISKSESDYLRYKLNDSGISERSIPAYGEGLVCCDSDEHDERGQITELYKVREAMVQKRKHKLEQLRDAAIAPRIMGDGDIAIVGWGSTKGAISEAISLLDNSRLAQIHFSWIYPLKKEHLLKLHDTKHIIVVENNSNAQFADLLKLNDIKVDATILQSNGFAFFSDTLVEKIAQKVREL